MKRETNAIPVAECASISGSTPSPLSHAANLDPQSRNAHAFRYTSEQEPNRESPSASRPVAECVSISSSTRLDVAGVVDPGSATPPPSRLWLWFVIAFLVQCAAWITWFVIASHHRVEEVPLERPLVSVASRAIYPV